MDPNINNQPSAEPAELPQPPEPTLTPPPAPAPLSPPAQPEPETVPPALTPPNISSANTTRKKRPLLKVALIVVVGAILLAGGSAAAYYGYVLPNQPENVLKTAIENTLKEKSFSTNTTLESNPTAGGDSPAVKLTAKTAVDTTKKAASIELSATVTGVTIPLEARLVDQNLYIKAGDLSTLSSLLSAYIPDSGNSMKKVLDGLSNKWILVDSTLLKQAGTNCAFSVDWSITNSDVDYLVKQYQSNPFMTIKSHATDKVNGKSAEKFELSMNDNKVSEYVKTLDKLSVVQNLQKCDKSSTPVNNSNSLADGDNTPITVWVDKGSKRIVKISSHSTDQDKQKDHIESSGEATISYGTVNITAPENAQPALKVLGDISNSLKDDPVLQSLFDMNSLKSF